MSMPEEGALPGVLPVQANRQRVRRRDEPDLLLRSSIHPRLQRRPISIAHLETAYAQMTATVVRPRTPRTMAFD